MMIQKRWTIFESFVVDSMNYDDDDDDDIEKNNGQKWTKKNMKIRIIKTRL